MNEKKAIRAGGRPRGGRLPHRFRELLHHLLSYSSRASRRDDFMRQACSALAEFSGCDSVEIRIQEGGRLSRVCAQRPEDGEMALDAWEPLPINADSPTPGDENELIPEPILQSVLKGQSLAPAPFHTRSGSFWTGDTARPILMRDEGDRSADFRTVVIGGAFQSLALLPVPVDENASGAITLASRRRDFFTKEDIQVYEAVAETLGVAIAHHAAQWALRERVKELTCLHGISTILQRQSLSLDEQLTQIVDLLPPGWQYPEATCARIILDGRPHATAGFRETAFMQSADLTVNELVRGRVEIAYLEEKPELDEGPFLKEERNLIDMVATTLEAAIAHRESQLALRERVKELTCVYGIAKLAQQPGLGTEALLQEVVELLPPAWQYPEITSARIELDGRGYCTAGYRAGTRTMTQEIAVSNETRGFVEVGYAEERPQLFEGPFLKEERSLIEQVAGQIGMIIERREGARERAELQEQLRHADRLATIGQLAAGAAHELNEPLGSILGFAQLAKDFPGIPVQAAEDMDKIVRSALHAREIIKKLMIFARQMPTNKARFDLNKLVREGFYFLESRCAKEGVEIERHLADDLPEITADPSQIHQVLVNLMVNAVQAMPDGGKLTIRTHSGADHVFITVEDTGTGMSEDVLMHMFVPFFTTKEVGRGTGLGLSVVHGIVTSHGGKIRVESEQGRGSLFEVSLPISGSPVIGGGETR